MFTGDNRPPSFFRDSILLATGAAIAGAVGAQLGYLYARAYFKTPQQIDIEKEIREKAVPIGTVMAYAGRKEPEGWLFCDGRKLDTLAEPKFVPLTQHLGGVNLPNLCGRVIVGAGEGKKMIHEEGGEKLTQRKLGQTFGEEEVQLAIEHLPAHKHDGEARGTTNRGNELKYGIIDPNNDQASKDNNYYSSDDGVAGWRGGQAYQSEDKKWSLQKHTHDFYTKFTTETTGDGKKHNNMQPSFVLNFIIKY